MWVLFLFKPKTEKELKKYRNRKCFFLSVKSLNIIIGGSVDQVCGWVGVEGGYLAMTHMRLGRGVIKLQNSYTLTGA